MLRRLSVTLFGVLVLAALPAATASAAATCAASPPLGAAQAYNEFVLGNGTRGSESEGAIAYGGNLSASGMTVGTRLSLGSGSSFPALVVNGTGNSFNLQAGSAYVRNLTGSINFNGGGRRLADPPIDFDAAFTDLRARSAAWTATAANGTANVVDSTTTGTALGGNVLLLQGTDPQLNVFSVTPAQLVGLKATFIRVPSGSTALINVSGTNVTVNGEVRYYDGSTYRQADDSPVADAVDRTVWNLTAATTVTLNTGSAFGGTILAPYAAVTAQNVGHNNGAVIAASFSSSFETHQYLFPSDGCLPPVTSTPPDDTPPDDTPPATGTPELHVSKTADHSTVAPGDTVVFTLGVTNSGTADASDVVLSDTVPVGLDVTAAASGCTIAGATVRCDAGTVATGQTKTFTVTTHASSLAAPSAEPDDQLTVTKVEQQISLPANTTTTTTATCDGGGVAADGSVRIDAVDQGTGTLASVQVVSLRTTADGHSYEAVVANHATGQAQGKLETVCLPPATTGGHALLFGDEVATTQAFTAGRHSVTFECGAGRTPIAPSIDVTAGAATVAASIPTTSTSREIDLDIAAGGATATLGVRCLSNLTGAADGTTTQLVWTPIQQDITVAPGAVTTEQLTCGDQAKGIVAGWDLDSGLLPLGNEAQPKTRVFTFWNPTGQALHGTIYLLCLDVHTGAPQGISDVTNTVTGTSSSAQGSGAVLSASALVRIQGGGDAGDGGDAPQVTVDAPAGSGGSSSGLAAPLSRLLAVTPPPPPPSAAPPAKAATATAAVVSGGAIRVSVACAIRCSGVVELKLLRAVRAGGHMYKKGARIGSARFSRTGTVTVRLPKALAKQLARTSISVVVTSGAKATMAKLVTRA